MVSRFNFKNKVALITGSSSGIGEEIAVHLNRLGANVTITGRDTKRLNKVAERCQSTGSEGQVLPVVADVTKDDDAKVLMSKTIEKYGKLDILVNNAGMYQVCTLSDDKCINYLDDLYRTNVRSVVYLTKLAVPYLEKTKGNIINVSSIASVKVGLGNTLYSMSKASIDMFTKHMALELGPKGIRCNAINPAAIRTPIFGKVDNSDLTTDRMAQIAAKSYPVGRIGEPIDCANAVSFLASEDASFITGTCLLLDGGSIFTSLIMPDQN